MTKKSFLEQIPTYASLVALAAVLAAAWSLNRMRHHGLIVGFLAIQLLFGLGLLTALIIGIDPESKSYVRLFFGSLIFPALFSWALSFKWAFELPASRPAWLALLISTVIAIGIPIYLRDLARGSDVYLVIATVFAFPGILSLLTTAGALSRAETTMHLGLSLFWMFTGIYAYALAAGYSNQNLRWMEAAWVPPLIAFLCFGLTAMSLNITQRELSHAALHADVAEEAR